MYYVEFQFNETKPLKTRQEKKTTRCIEKYADYEMEIEWLIC